MTGPGRTRYAEPGSPDRCLESFYVKWKAIPKIPSNFSKDMGSPSGQIFGQLSINIPYVHISNDSVCANFDDICTTEFLYDLFKMHRG